LLGGFEVSVGSRVVGKDAWRLKKSASLVKLLALAPGNRLHREQAMDLLWPDSVREVASNNLRQALHAARKALDPREGSRYLAGEGETLVLCPADELWVDVGVFEEAARTARRSRDPGAYGAAIDTYAGDLLPEDRYEEWAEARREGLRRLYLGLLLEAAELHETRGEHEPAMAALRRATAAEPTLEEAHAALMRLHARSGRPERALAQYERLRDALLRRLGTRPGEATRRLRDEIAAGGLASRPPVGPPPQEDRSSDSGRHNLPVPRTSFVGREREMAEVKRALAMARLLTLTGAGGSGKTRLAVEMARDLAGAYPDGAWLVELAPVSEGGLVPQAVASALGLKEMPGEQLADTLADALRPETALLVLDNCEHLAGEAARLVDALLDSCPRLRVLATSREPLGVGGEVIWRVPPLSLPADDGRSDAESLMRCESVRLFLDRARQRLPDFRLTAENAAAVAAVCRRLDGVPLAIELATARMGVLAVEQVAQRLETSLDVLGGAGRTVEPRQRTLRATLDWSFDLLSEAERAMLRRLSVFAGGWTLEAAEATCSEGLVEREHVLDLLGGLVDKSLVVATATTDGAVRYRLLEPIRQYAGEKLGEGSETDETLERHAAFFLALAEEAEPELSGPWQDVWLDRLEGEHDNLRAALSWLLERGRDESALRLAAALWRFWHVRGYLSEGIEWMDRVLAEGEPSASPARLKALEGVGWLTQFQGDSERAEAAYKRMLELSRELGDKGNVATALNSLGTVAAYRGEHARARELLQENLVVLRQLEEEGNTATARKRFHALNLLGILALNEEGDYSRGTSLWEESLALVRKAGDAYHVGLMLSNLGYAALLQGDHARASARCEEALTQANKLGAAGAEIIPETMINLGLAALQQGHQERAAASFEEALSVSEGTGRKPSVINALEGMSSLAAALGESARAAHLWGAAEATREATGLALAPVDLALHEPYLALARSQLGEAAWEVALTQGRSMSLEETVWYALSKETDRTGTSDLGEGGSARDEPTDNLTPREREVASLVAQGLTNRQIAAELFISERTAGNHVAKILRKLGLRSRAQVAVWAAEQRSSSPDAD